MKPILATLFLVLTLPLAAQSAPQTPPILELRLLPKAVDKKNIPREFLIILANNGDHEIHVPVPSLLCADPQHGSIWLRDTVQPPTPIADGPVRDCPKNPSTQPILVRIKSWVVLSPGQNFILANVDDRPFAPAPGNYDYWTDYTPPELTSEDRQALSKAGIDVPHTPLTSAHITFTNKP